MGIEERLRRIVATAPAAAAGNVRIAAAAASDLAHSLDVLGAIPDERPDDAFEKRDPDYIRDTLPALRLMSDAYFRGEVRGLDNVPRDEPVLLVGNHSGGTLIADTFVFAQAFYDHFGPEREFHQLAHDLVFAVPGVRETLMRYGTVPASPENMRRALDRGAALLVYPGGDHESFRPSWESSEIDFDGRKGFVRLSLELGVRVVPVVAIGGQETALFLGRGRRIARALSLDRRLRLKVVPPQIAPPFGLTVLDLPGRIPLPAKIAIEVLPPIDLRERLGPRPDPAEGYELVTETMQETLDELAEERTLPVIG
jgi:1-acyl-sn-glycerol-3-phosphate acyltransferase